MHLRIDSKSLRFRILQNEVARLENGESIEEILTLPNKKIIFRLIISDGSEIEFNDANDDIVLLVPKIIFQNLIENSPCKEGVGRQFKELFISLEIDVLKKRK